jgi:hypothetical protein
MGRAAVGSAAGVLGGLSLLAATGWAGAVLSIAVVFALVGAACWVLGDPHRPGRLALLIRTCRVPAVDLARPPDGATVDPDWPPVNRVADDRYRPPVRS